jgi:hypothetical protein
MRATAFLATARAFVEQTAPGMLAWDTRESGGQSYVCVRPSESGRDEMGVGEEFSVFYAVTHDALTLTLSEPLLRRSLARSRAAATEPAGASAGPPPAAAPRPWQGRDLAVHVDRRALDVLAALGEMDPRTSLQRSSWDNLPVLNEWKRRFPGRDPVEVHAELWHETLSCPGGGEYVWNEEDRTMSSTVYGHPGRPLEGPVVPRWFSDLSSLDLGVTFLEGGLEARVVVEQDEP